ncbi:N-acetyltransferase [Actinobacteria bacterium YIM 96077]|uniref:N-acetyltransferase domain-containing protein n=1 Tax=Phytoactinopolyspora halophila TaxID=1981511 RepID=A0A329QKR2_9ACTN|nr:GNAT family N-acetyltransferase [Phytoactinopolyspora halophila]AYY13096.1 N-acetyltransferase [Actinobacteria bacterium YIM 96077]RAW11108.1 hypothetical protein DPM12_17340 [Phytoactinopolyspora halophila]
MAAGQHESGITIDRLASRQARAAGAVIAASHADYPAFRQIFPDPIMRRRALLPFMTATARDAAAHGHGLVARDGDDVLGVALWMPPGTFPPSGLRKFRMTPALIRVAVVTRRAVGRLASVGSSLEKAHPPGPSWYLQAMSVHPRAQRRGVGTRLIEPAIALADEAGHACYLQTSDPANVDYYQRFGFELTQPAIATFDGGPSYIGMSRPPSRPS